MTPEKALLVLSVEIAVILGASRLLGVLFRRLQQPQVIGEIIAGILLGPSLFGWVAPEMTDCGTLSFFSAHRANPRANRPSALFAGW